jgi:hypothetical protein
VTKTKKVTTKSQSRRRRTPVKTERPRRQTHQEAQESLSAKPAKSRSSRKFNYDLNYKELDLRKHPELYRVGVGEQGVLLVEPYKSEILPLWRFKTPLDATKSAKAIFALFKRYRREKDLVGMDMARKFLQMGFTRSRRYANHKSGQKYDSAGKVLPFENDTEKAKSAAIFKTAWKQAEADAFYADAKSQWKERLG